MRVITAFLFIDFRCLGLNLKVKDNPPETSFESVRSRRPSMQTSRVILLLLFMVSMTLQSCDSASKSPSAVNNSDDTNRTSIRQSLLNSGAMMPGEKETVDASQAQRDEHAARQIEGDRGVFSTMHRDDGITLKPQNKSSMALAEGDETIPVTRNPTVINTPIAGDNTCTERQAICVQACATAHAQAVAFAFAHASVTACAWAEAWACVFTVSPFTRVCSWARSQACSTAFASAFAFGYASDTKTVCDRQCSN
jgi:hypothetical protein